MWYNWFMRNDFRLPWFGARSPKDYHFRLCEFEDKDGFACVDDRVIESLEGARADLNRLSRREVQIVVTCGTRTEATNQRLGRELGWTDEGGIVARDSRHLPKYGGIAVDIYARYPDGTGWARVPQDTLASACRHHFGYVKADYEDGHVHADNREA